MPVIKSIHAAPIEAQATVLDLGDLQRQADAIVAGAAADAERILAEARGRADEIVARASETGRAEGHAEGLERGTAEGREAGRAEALAARSAEIDELLKGWTAALDWFDGEREEMLVAARADVLEFAFALARKIVFRAAATDPTVIEDQLAAALAHLTRPTGLHVRVHPDDRDRAALVLPGLVERLGAHGHVRLEDDDTITRGGCRIGTERGGVDATLERQLERIAETLLPADHALGAAPAPDDTSPESDAS